MLDGLSSPTVRFVALSYFTVRLYSAAHIRQDSLGRQRAVPSAGELSRNLQRRDS